jgi:hypothetical protein
MHTLILSAIPLTNTLDFEFLTGNSVVPQTERVKKCFWGISNEGGVGAKGG